MFFYRRKSAIWRESRPVVRIIYHLFSALSLNLATDFEYVHMYSDL